MLVRHGESEWNKIGRIQGQTDTPLTPNGVAQAEAVAIFLQRKLDGIDVLMFSSPMQRARQTAEIIARRLAYPPNDVLVDERLNDFNLGEISGTYGWDKVAEDHPELARLRLEDPLNFHPPGGESGAQFRDRLADFSNDPGDGGRLRLVVSHGVVNKFIRSIRLGLQGADIIALGESQESVYELVGGVETEHSLGAGS